MAHGQIVAPDDAHVGNTLPVLVQGLYRGNHIVQVLLGQAAAVDGEAYHIGQLHLLLRSLQVVLHGVVAQLRDPDAVPADQFHGEALAGEGVVAPLAVEELVHVDVDRVAAGGQHHALVTPAL